MVLVDIDALSDEELKRIAQQRDVEDWESLSREDLIECIEDTFDEEASERISDASATGHRYAKLLTKPEYEGSFGFPGVGELPDSYNETSIYLLPKDANWAYAFWNISPNTSSQLETKGSQLTLRVVTMGENGTQEDSFDIGISKGDIDWSVELPWAGRDYKAVLVAHTGKEEEVLAQSNVVSVPKIWLSEHVEALADPARFNVLISSLVTKDGSIINNRQVRDILKNLGEEAN